MGDVPNASIQRLQISIRGAVQGVGFRPFIYRLATELGLDGSVCNTASGVLIEAQGRTAALQEFLLRISSQKPPRSFITSLEPVWLPADQLKGFVIRESQVPKGSAPTALVMADIATCPQCLAEILDPANRRYFYPFTNCTHCGPRFSIIESLPYDRANTSMRQFQMCPACQAEFANPTDRRFHAQPNACPLCGPKLQLWEAQGHPLPISGTKAILQHAADALRHGAIIALKGLGGFHLLVDASDADAVRRLRAAKHREEKPLAVMVPSLQVARQLCEISPLEERLLLSPESPIVLLRHGRSNSGLVTDSVAPGNPHLGVMLPYTPLHHLLLSLFAAPLVATSGNLSDEPICTDEFEAVKRLRGIPDLFLVHDRPIVRHVDDSIARVLLGREQILRRARGYAPLPVSLTTAVSAPVLAVGAHLKNSVSLTLGNNCFVSQHIGNLETPQAHDAFRRVLADLCHLYSAEPALVVADKHPDYLSTQHARQLCAATAAPNTIPQLKLVQHHVAHVLSCMADNALASPVLGVSWDGTGFGDDGTIWGGEFFHITNVGCKRIAHLRSFPLPGGDSAIREPRRAALGLLFECAERNWDQLPRNAISHQFGTGELRPLQSMLESGLNSPLTSSVGRLFDAVSALTGLVQVTRFEGQAAMALEFACSGETTDAAYSFGVRAAESSEPLLLDWQPCVTALLRDLANGVPVPLISAQFHNGLVEALVAVAKHARVDRVVLSGGCFQNRYLTERAVLRLRDEGFEPYWHQRVPPNDGGICLGQAVAAGLQNV